MAQQNIELACLNDAQLQADCKQAKADATLVKGSDAGKSALLLVLAQLLIMAAQATQGVGVRVHCALHLA